MKSEALAGICCRFSYRERLEWKKKVDAEKEKEEARQKELRRIKDGP